MAMRWIQKNLRDGIQPTIKYGGNDITRFCPDLDLNEILCNVDDYIAEIDPPEALSKDELKGPFKAKVEDQNKSPLK